ncbi:MAG: Lrp/AsnC family transcriptional regulator [Deltaproteobacteria bacterium]|nr:Lrp/AsnC family transcriptional regulator [Deltaproteobacteria bacterium]
MTNFSKNEAAVLNYIQRSIPLVQRPFQKIGTETGLSEKAVLEIISRLKQQGIIRNIAAIFNGESLGYQLSLIAFEVPEACLKKAAAAINAHPGISHNYLRAHRYNIWFTLALEKSLPFDDAVEHIAQKAGARDFLILRNEKLLKIGLKLPIGDDYHAAEEAAAGLAPQRAEVRDFTDEERTAVLLLQTDLPIVARPFLELVNSAGEQLSESRLLELACQFEKQSVLRRFAAVLRHMQAGFHHNAMTAWKPKAGLPIEEQVKPFLDTMAVTHLYLRTLYPGRWEHPLFAMVHARTEAELDALIKSLSAASGLAECLVLKSLKELKKQKVMYFSPDFMEWERLDQ